MELQPGLMLVHGNRAEDLRDLLVAWLRTHPLEPLESECVLVQSNGIAQWLRLALADGQDGCGVAAALEFLLPARFVWQAYRAVLGAQAVPTASLLDKEPLSWRLMRLLPALLDEPGFEPLRRFLADDAGVRKRYQLARRLADLFDQYQVYRADWLEAWARGAAVLPDPWAASRPLDAADAWQATLWQALLADLSGASRPVGRAAIHEAFMAHVRSAQDGARPTALPRRIVVFGISSLPRQTLEALAALARWSQIVVCVNNPCAHYWADIMGEQEVLRARFRRQSQRRGAAGTAQSADLHQQTHPLLASWGREGRDFIGLLDDFDDPAVRARCGAALSTLGQRIDLFEALPGTTLLTQLQDDIRDLRPLAETRARWPAVDPARDASIRFHVAYSAQREVEILHDQLLAAFAADARLRPRDVIVMVPDMDAYAPHVQAVFGLYDARDRRHIPYAIADRTQRRADPLVIVLEQLLSLADLRLGVLEVLEWLDVPAVQARFGLQAEELPRLRTWAQSANVRWGLDAAQRRGFGLAQSPEAAHRYTWAFGLQRMLLGYAAGPDAPSWSGIEPYDEPGGLEAQALGGLARLIERVGHHWRVLREPATPTDWVMRYRALLQDFFQATTDEDEHTLMRFGQCLEDWQQACTDAALTEALPGAVVAAHLLDGLDAAGLSQRFFAGAVTFATLTPMRAIPFRRVCLLGMQDGAFPRLQVAADFDLMATHPRFGDRSRREDDRYLFLEALLSARDQLYVSWVGFDIHDGSKRPPSVLVAQLLDHLDQGWRCTDAALPVSCALRLEHPLQPFSRRYFPPEAQAAHSPLFTYAAEWRLQAPAVPPVSTGRLGRAAHPDAVDLQTLLSFLRHPVRAFFQQRLQVRFEAAQAPVVETEPYVVDGLSEWQRVQDLLDAALEPAQPADIERMTACVDAALARMQRRGDLVGEALGARDVARLRESVQAPLAAYVDACAAWPSSVSEPLPVQGRLPGDEATAAHFSDTLAGWRRNAQGDWCRIRLTASRLVDGSRRYRLAPMLPTWLEHVCAQVYGRPSTTFLIGPKGSVTFRPDPAVDWRTALWQTWWSIRDRGMCEALPVEPHVAGLWLRLGQPLGPDDRAWQDVEDEYDRCLAQDLYLRRSHPDFESFVANGEFFTLARDLYGALDAALDANASPGASDA